LLPAAVKLPNEAMIQYNLACYACQLGRTEDAREFLKRAMALDDSAKVKLMALDDPDLAPIWD
jgi:hypothetical protein